MKSDAGRLDSPNMPKIPPDVKYCALLSQLVCQQWLLESEIRLLRPVEQRSKNLAIAVSSFCYITFGIGVGG